jgi:p38 MAP kinase
MSVGGILIPTIFLAVSDNITVTELLGTDLHRLLTSRPLEKQFIQYFLYQILVRYTSSTLARHD